MLIFTVPVDLDPPCTCGGLKLNSVTRGAWTVKLTGIAVEPTVAVIITVVSVATESVVIENGTKDWPTAIVTDAGNVAVGLEQARVTTTGDFTALSEISTVPEEVVPPGIEFAVNVTRESF